MLTVLAITLAAIAVAGIIIGLFLFGLSAIWVILMYAIKLGFVLIPVAIAYVLIRNLFIW